MRNKIKNQKGVSLIAAVFIIVIVAFMGVIFLTLFTSSSSTSINDLQSAQALYVAEGGKEYILENRSFPSYSTGGATVNLGSGNFKVSTPTYLTADPGAAGVTINVQSAANFPNAGRIVIDSELIDYTGKNALQFTGATRGVGGTTAVSHPTANAAVYPVTTVTDNPLVAGSATINVNSTLGFLIPGIIKIDEEYIYCTGTNTNTQFTGCTRGYKGTTADSHPQLRNVFQYAITSTGTVTNANRQVETAVVGTGNSFYKGWFAKNGAAGNQVIAGVGFRPTAVLFYWTRQTAEGFAVNESMGFGFASGPGNQRAVAVESDDGSNRSNYSRVRSDTSVILMLLAPAAAARATTTLNARASLVSLDADGFTINWVVNENRADIIHFIALGRDVSNAFTGTITSPSGAGTGNQSVVGVGFRPDFVMLLNSSLSTAEAVDTPLAGKLFNIGFMTPAGQGAVSVCGIDDANNNNHPANWQQTTQAILGMSATCTQDSVASFVSMDADGFTIFWSDRPGAATPIYFLALKGGQHKIGSFTQPVATGNQTTASLGFQPQGLFMASANRAAPVNLAVVPGEISIGSAQSAVSRGTIWAETRNTRNPTDANTDSLTTSAFLSVTGTAGVPTINSQADFVRFNSDSFTLNWTTADATARQIVYWAIGPNAARSGANIAPVGLDWREVYP
jgi:MSHA biogenesis protein MshP